MIVGLIWLGANSGPAEGKPLWITAALVFLIGLSFQIIIDRARLELSPDGARLRQTGYALKARWSDICELRLSPGREGFVTREPMQGRGAGLLASFRGVALTPGGQFYDPEQRELLSQRRFIPIEAFAWHLVHGNMGEDVARFAPHLAHVLLRR